MARKNKQRGRGNILLSNEQDNIICTAIESYCTLNENDDMKKCIDEALNFFTHSPLHLKIFHEVLSNPKANKILFCMDNYVSEPQFYIYRREIVWRIAMMAYAMDIFSI